MPLRDSCCHSLPRPFLNRFPSSSHSSISACHSSPDCSSTMVYPSCTQSSAYQGDLIRKFRSADGLASADEGVVTGIEGATLASGRPRLANSDLRSSDAPLAFSSRIASLVLSITTRACLGLKVVAIGPVPQPTVCVNIHLSFRALLLDLVFDDEDDLLRDFLILSADQGWQRQRDRSRLVQRQA